ncbi:gamma-glutamyltransferase [Mesorhizobium sp.]|uniref:gamma-glutamyltransferase n=1 Tax=Mesorhizobium sp. TaxID=1871066 RepID=UPI00258ADCB2|nr:gamma-glutamyltransferase [Mesorhizobium sp.]
MGRGAVASNHPVATHVGLDILRAGGSAADAAVAVSLCLGVVEPFMSGLGGDGFYHVFDGTSYVYEGTGAAPTAATASRFIDGLPDAGPLSISPPGALAGLAMMHALHGRMSFADLCAPAIRIARDGFLTGHTYRRFVVLDGWRLRAHSLGGAVYLPGDKPPPVATRIRNPALADSLKEIAKSGIETFYRGTLASRIVEDLAKLGSLVTGTDLAATEAIRRTPISISYRGYQIVQTPPVSTGFALLQELAILEHFDLAAIAEDTTSLVHLMVEAKKLAFLDREQFATDPAAADIPIDQILSADRIAGLANEIDPHKAADRPLSGPASAGHTTYFCVVSREGQAVSAIQSLNAPFGSGVMLANTGIVMNNRMTCWHLDPDHPNYLMPGKKVRQTMNAPIVLKEGKLWAVLGTPGADNQVQVNMQAIVGLIDLGLDPQQVVEAPRWWSDQPGQGANWPHSGDCSLSVETSYASDILDGLRALGHRLKLVPPLEGPCSLEVIRVADDGIKIAGSDPRRDGWAAAHD